MVKLIGCFFIVFAAGSVGLSGTLRFYSQLRTIKEFVAALEILKCEMNYTLAPLAKLCRSVSGRTRGPCSTFFRSFGKLLDDGVPRSIAVRRLLSDEKYYRLTGDAQIALLELFESLGAYELEGENQLMQMTALRLKTAVDRLEREKKPLAKSYVILGFCAGLALMILFL